MSHKLQVNIFAYLCKSFVFHVGPFLKQADVRRLLAPRKKIDSSCFIPFGIVSLGPKKMLVLLFLDRDRENDVFYSFDLTEY